MARVKVKLCLLGGNYFKTLHQAEVNFENFIEVKFRDILLTGTGHRDRHLYRYCPGQTGTYGKSTHHYIGIRYQWPIYIAYYT